MLAQRRESHTPEASSIRGRAAPQWHSPGPARLRLRRANAKWGWTMRTIVASTVAALSTCLANVGFAQSDPPPLKPSRILDVQGDIQGGPPRPRNGRQRDCLFAARRRGPTMPCDQRREPIGAIGSARTGQAHCRRRGSADRQGAVQDDVWKSARKILSRAGRLRRSRRGGRRLRGPVLLRRRLAWLLAQRRGSSSSLRSSWPACASMSRVAFSTPSGKPASTDAWERIVETTYRLSEALQRAGKAGAFFGTSLGCERP